jgi:hypothetical protein
MSTAGGPAYPTSNYAAMVPLSTGYSEGMTLRDYFAAKVLPRCLEFCSTNSKAAEEAYRIADAMLAAREQK